MNKECFTNSLDRLSETSVDFYLYKHRPKTNVIYLIVIIAIGITVVLLPFIYVDITIHALGYVRPVTEKTTITASITEIIDSVYVREGQVLRKGDLILTQRMRKNKNQQDYRQGLIRELDMKIADLKELTCGHVPKKFSSVEILEDHNHYLSQRQQIITDLEQYRIEWERNKYLFDAGLISESEYNDFYYRYVGHHYCPRKIFNNSKSNKL